MPSSPSKPQRINYVFVDFENVHDIDCTVIAEKSVVFTLLLGPNQTRLDVKVVEKLLECSATVKLIRLTSSGKNALDFALSYYAGRTSATDPAGYIHIVSKDAGFQPLVEHLVANGISAKRHDSFQDLSFAITPKPPAPVAVDETFEKALANLRKNANRPKSKKALVKHLESQFANHLGDSGIAKLIKRLGKDGHLSLSDKDKVTYHLKG